MFNTLAMALIHMVQHELPELKRATKSRTFDKCNSGTTQWKVAHQQCNGKEMGLAWMTIRSCN